LLIDQLETLSRERPVLIVFEDLHWVDPTSLELLEVLVSGIAGSRIMAIVTYRPEFVSNWIGEAHVTSVSLNKLDAKSSVELMHAVTGGLKMPDELVKEIISKTDGVPLFVEELTKTIVESGMLVQEGGRYILQQPLSSLTIPATLQDSLMARLDRFSSVKSIAQIGATIGREFGYDLLLTVAKLKPGELDDTLQKLVDAGLVFRRGRGTRANYFFKHALIQDIAYSSLLKTTRQKLHEDIAVALKNKFKALVDSQPELIAYHMDEAGSFAEALVYWRKAAKQASSHSSMQEAYSHLGKALRAHEAMPQDDESKSLRLDLLSERVTPIIATRDYASRELVDVYEDAQVVFKSLGKPTRQIFPFIFARCVFDFTRGQMNLGLDRAEEFVETALLHGFDTEVLLGRRLCGMILAMSGRAEQAAQHLEFALDNLDTQLADEIGFVYGQDILVGANCYYAFSLCALGKFSTSKVCSETALERAIVVNHANTIAFAGAHAGILLNEMQDQAGLKRCIDLI
jgi:tetratricopeptide (TPR) repeat protein